MLLLSDNQRKLFEFLPKPVVLYGASAQKVEVVEDQRQGEEIDEAKAMKHEWSLLTAEKQPIQKAIIACQAYQKILKNKEEMDPLDIKLVYMLDDQVKKVFNIKDADKAIMINEKSKSTTNHQKRIIIQSIQNRLIHGKDHE